MEQIVFNNDYYPQLIDNLLEEGLETRSRLSVRHYNRTQPHSAPPVAN